MAAAAEKRELTLLEREVMLLFAQGHACAAIATKISVSVEAVEMHHASLINKLGLSTDAELVRLVLRQRILSES
jgi:DNA-binding CsgD family transcriptional regulator